MTTLKKSLEALADSQDEEQGEIPFLQVMVEKTVGLEKRTNTMYISARRK